MSDLTKDPVSLEHLKRAVDEYVAFGDAPYSHNRQLRRAHAWRTAFEWRNQERFDMVTKLQTPNMVEYAEGMDLIREKLT